MTRFWLNLAMKVACFFVVEKSKCGFLQEKIGLQNIYILVTFTVLNGSETSEELICYEKKEETG